MTHAFFKALLFLGSGSVIHAMGGEQDMRKMGGLKKHLPSTYWTFLIGAARHRRHSAASPASSPRTRSSHAAAANGQWILWAVGLVTAGLTAFYMFRSVYLTFDGEFRGTHEQEHHLHESPPSMTLPLWILAVGAVVAGWVGLPKLISDGQPASITGWSRSSPAPVASPRCEHEMSSGADGRIDRDRRR